MSAMAWERRGGISKGCERCRARKIKCDQARPTCQRCKKTSHFCEYRDMMTVLFRDETPAVEKKAQQMWRTRAKPKSPLSIPSYYEYVDSNKFPGFAMTTDLVECSRNRFFYDYPLPSDDPENPQKGVLDYLPDFYNSAGPGTCLHAAVHAVALANFYRRAGPSSSKTLLLSRKAYGEALALVKTATQDKVQAGSDHVVMAVHLLGMYESMSVTSFDERNSTFWNAHTYGLATLLKLRPIPKPQDGVRYRLFHTVNMAMLSACLTYDRESYLSRKTLENFYSDDFSIVQVASLIHLGVDLLAQYKACTTKRPLVDLFEAQYLRDQLCTLDSALAEWGATTQIDHFDLQEFENPLAGQPRWMRMLLQHTGCPKVNHRYECVQTAFAWNTYRMVRILINKALLDSRNFPPGHKNARLNQSLDIIETLVDDICSSVLANFVTPIPGKPTAENEWDICGIRGFFLTGPLTMASECLWTIITNPKAEEKADWVDNVRSFLGRWIYHQESAQPQLVSQKTIAIGGSNDDA